MNLSPSSIVIVFISMAAAAFLGFAAHRASFCSVKSIAEIISTRRAYMLSSFVKITIWVSAIALPLSWLGLSATTSAQAWAFGWPAIVGGALFGIGATMNGGCALYTLTRLTSGNLALLYTLIGFLLGYLIQWIFLAKFASPAASPAIAPYDDPDPASLAWLGLVWLLFLWEIRGLWRSSAHRTWKDRLFATRYKLSSAAVVFGIGNGLLFVLWGPWTYTSALHQQVISMETNEIKIGLFTAVLGGMVYSSWQRGDAFITWGERKIWLVHLAGGTLMGMGAAIAPGGNDALLLYGIPMLSPHAFPAFAAMLAAIAITLLIGKSVAGLNIRTDCNGDLFRIARNDG